jgi:predicted anti-sigma-YlaC factor YlaD
MHFSKTSPAVSLLLVLSLLAAGCIKKIALRKVAGALTAEGSTVFTGDDDPQLIADALPFALKMHESLLEGLPDDVNLLLATGKAFCMYAYAFIHVPADTISDIRINEKAEHLIRAKNMYLRAKGYLFRALEIRHPGFTASIEANKTDSALAMTTIADSALLYWTGASWMGAFTTDKFDMKLALDMPKAVAFMNRLLQMHESYGNGSVHDFFISYYGSMPKSMGGNEEKAREHFARSIELSQGRSAVPYVSLATSVCVNEQNHKEFVELLTKALAIDVNQYPGNRLANIISQRKAQWLMKHIDDYFLWEEEEEDTLEDTEEFRETDEDEPGEEPEK